jgi:arginase family enzyme
MPKMTPEQFKKYQSLNKPAFEFGDDAISAFFAHAAEQGYSLDTTGFLPHPGFFQAPYKTDYSQVDIAMLGSPLDLGAIGLAGARHAPLELRNASRNYGPQHDVTGAVPFMDCQVIDAGDVQWSATALDTRLNDIYETVYAIASQGASVLNCGGEHTTAFGALKGLSKAHGDEAFGLVHIDAHCDTMSTWGGDDVNDGSVFRQAVLNGFIDPERTVQIGIRGRANFLWEFSKDTGMTVITADEVFEKGVPYVLDQIKEIVGTKEKTYFSLDVDGIDAQYMMGTTGPEPFGLLPRQVRDIILGCYGMNFIGADMVEYNPNRDANGTYGHTAAALYWELLCLLSDAKTKHQTTHGPTNW